MRRDDPEAVPLAPTATLPASCDQVIEALSPLITAERLARIEAVIQRRMRSVVPILDAIDGPHNVAAVLRSADAFGLQEVHLIEGPNEFLVHRRITQGADRWLDLVRHDNPHTCIATLRARGFKVYVATMEGTVTPEQLANVGKLAIVFGNEKIGVRGALTTLCDESYAIPMQGFVESLNVSVAAAITLYAATRGRQSDLTEMERDQLRARFMRLSVPRADEIVAEHLVRQRT
jgi:tRNA (guanosine-2'-O-)-methyltransferase